MSINQTDAPESGLLPGRYEWVAEPSPGEIPSDPNYKLLSDAVRSFEAEPGASYSRQDTLGTPSAQDHFRGTEDPSLSVGYDLQRFFVDSSGNPNDASGYGMIRDAQNQLPATLMYLSRREYPGGNDGAGVREYTVVRGAAVETVNGTLDPSAEQPILMELDHQPRRVRSYKIHQPAAGTTLDVSSTSANDTMDITIESEAATTTETITLNGTTAVTTTATFSDIDAALLSGAPEGDITVTDGSGTTFLEITGGLTYSDDDQPVDGDRGVPTLGAGSRGSTINTTFEHFVGDRFERPVGEAVRPRVNSASFAVENEISTDSLHATRAPTVDTGNRTVTVDADVAGRFMSHDSMMEHLQKVQHDLEHELGGGVITYKNTVPSDSATRTAEADQAVASESETFEASGDPELIINTN